MTKFNTTDTGQLSAPEMLANIMSLLDINISYDELSTEEQGQLLFALQTNLQTNETGEEQQLITEILVSGLEMYVPPFLLLLGTCGNFLSLCILLNKTMIRQSSNVFLAVLAIVDSIVLLVGLLRRWITDISGIDLQLQANWLCKAVSLLTYSSSQLSVWLIIAVTVLRYLAVSKPFKASRYSNHKIAKYVIISLALCATAMNLHFIWTVKLASHHYGVNGETFTKCKAEETFDVFITRIWPWIDASLFALVPFVLLFVFNILIIVHMVRATRWRRQNQIGTQRNGNLSRNNIKLTVTLLTVSFSFLLTTLPISIVMILRNSWRDDTDISSLEELSYRRLISTCAELMMYLNHSINFFLYCAVGKTFRHQVARTFCRRTETEMSNSKDHSHHMHCSRDGRCRVLYKKQETVPSNV